MPRKSVINKLCLIISQSGRALAHSATRAGFNTRVIDCFADTDTIDVALSCSAIPADFSGQRTEIKRLVKHHSRQGLAGIVIGSGFESCPNLILELQSFAPVIGCSANTMQVCCTPETFFNLLDRFHIHHPEISFTVPDAGDDWLVKQAGSCGGRHIHRLNGTKSDRGDQYYQQYLQGCAMSVVFLANGESFKIIGFNETWTEHLEQAEFSYAGAITVDAIPADVEQQIQEVLIHLVPELELQGLCGMDFILTADQQVSVLEINPRPPATFELHECDGESLFKAHIEAVQSGRLPTPLVRPKVLQACRIVYAPHALEIPMDFCWPDWVADRPATGRTITQGEPLCSIFASHRERGTVLELLSNRYDILIDRILQRNAA